MHSLLKSVVIVSLVLSSSVFAQPEGEVVIRTRDGKVRQGRVLSETQRGYLFATARGTSIIEFANIVDLQKPEPAAEQPPLVAAASTPVVAAPPPPPPAPQPVATAAAMPPSPPERPATEVGEIAPSAKSPREGFHFGLGVNAGVNVGGPSAQLQAHFEFNFGKPVYRVSANLGASSMWGSGFVNASIDNMFQLNLGQVYAFGVGAQVGLAVGVGAFFYLAPVVQPVIIKLGDRGQHQLSLTASIAALSTSYSGYSGFYLTYAGTFQVVAGYTFLF